MRKLIAILLITAIACAEVDTTPKAEKSEFKELLDILDFDVDSVELFFTEIFDGIGNFLGSIWDTIKGGIQWMKNSGLWDSVKQFLKLVENMQLLISAQNIFLQMCAKQLLMVFLKHFKKY